MGFESVNTAASTRELAATAASRAGPRGDTAAEQIRHEAPDRAAVEAIVTRAVTGASQAAEAEVDRRDLNQAVEQINTALDGLSVGARFRIDDRSESLQVVIENRQTGEVIRKIPPDDVLRRREALIQVAGLTFDAKA